MRLTQEPNIFVYRLGERLLPISHMSRKPGHNIHAGMVFPRDDLLRMDFLVQ